MLITLAVVAIDVLVFSKLELQNPLLPLVDMWGLYVVASFWILASWMKQVMYSNGCL